MKNKFLTPCIISLGLIPTGKVLGSQTEFLPLPQEVNQLKGGTYSFGNGDTTVKKDQISLSKFIRKNSQRDPYEIDEESESLYREGDFDGAAKAFVAAATLGIIENQNTLYQMDEESLRYIQNQQYSKLEVLCQKLKEDWLSGQ